MKKTTLVLAVIIGFAACKSKTDNATVSKEFSEYVDSVNNVTPEYTVEYWTVIDQEYQVRALRAEAELANLNEEQKKQIEDSKVKYNELKAKYESEIEKNKAVNVANKKQQLRNGLFGEGKIGTDLNFDWVTSNNILSVYESFVSSAKANSDNYSREDWDEVKVLYEALDTRKNAVEKELASGDNMKISKEKIKFASLESVSRPMTKSEENSEAKNN